MRLPVVLLFVLVAAPALANPFGSSVPVEPVPGFGFAGLIAWTAEAQREFYEGLTGALRQVAVSSGALWLLLGMSFAYGVVHAAGPGHGKVVITSYMLASGDTARRGAFLALGAALVQASMAVLLVGLLAGVFGLSRAFLSDATITLERFSYALIIVLGLYLIWRTVRGLVPQPATLAPAGHEHHHHAHLDPHHVHDAHCGCDHAHMPDASQVSRATGLGQSLMLILGAGARPCTGALLVLVLALSQGLLWAGALAAYAMGAGTALMVGMLAVFASGLSGLLKRGGQGNSPASAVMRYAPVAFSLMGGLVIMAFGGLLLAASLAR